MKIQFNPDGKDTLTFGECLWPAMEITDAEDARQYLADYVAYIQKELDARQTAGGMTAEQIVRTNLGLFAGCYNRETRERVERLFGCVHPVLGPVAVKPQQEKAS